MNVGRDRDRRTDALAGIEVPRPSGDKFVIGSGEVSLEIDPRLGGRVTGFRLSGLDALVGPEAGPLCGSTFWPSPQSQWHWPPPPDLDEKPYQAGIHGRTLRLTSRPCERLGVSFVKRVALVEGVARFDYEIRSLPGAQPLFLAPWEVSRVPATGLVFFPIGEGGLHHRSALPVDIHVDDDVGVAFFSPAEAAITADAKLFADGAEGWLAHARDGLLFVKAWADVPPAQQAPDEAEIEVFMNGPKTYVELEQQGPYTRVASRRSVTWSVRWALARLPVGARMPDRAALVELARALVRDARSCP